MSNVKLSDAELALACDANVLLTKNSIIHKVYDMFGSLSKTYTEETVRRQLPGDILKSSPKISRGENYLGLPWVMLDYPRYFSGHNIFSIRTMFWWGNYFSQFIFLKGEFLPENIIERITEPSTGEQWFLCIGTDPWQHHFEATNMLGIATLTPQQINDQIRQCGFLKLGTKIPIERWESVENFMHTNFIKFLATAI